MQNEWAVPFLIFLAIYAPTFGLLQFMVLRVNRHLPANERLSHGWPGSRLRVEYTRLFPRSQLYAITMKMSAMLAVIAAVFAAWRFSGYISN